MLLLRNSLKFYQRNALYKESLKQSTVGGPVDCIDDHIERNFCDNEKVINKIN